MAFLAGETLTADALNQAFGASVKSTQATSGTTTSTSYTATLTSGTACSCVFVAPTSGKVLLHNILRSFTSTTAFVFSSVEVRTGGTVGSGTVVLVAGDAEAHAHQSNVQSFRFGVVHELTGLTAGATYNARQLFRVSTGTGTYLDKQLVVEPAA